MTKNSLLKLLFQISKYYQQGISLTELLVALVVSSVVISFAAKGAVNLLSFSDSANAKSTAVSTLNRTIAYMQEEIKSSLSITQENSLVAGTSCLSTAVDSNECLVLTFPASYNENLHDDCDSGSNEGKVYYGYEDISSNSNEIWLKPGILKRKVVCYEITNDGGTPADFSDDTTALVTTNWTVVGDGLISVNETQPTVTCDQDSMTNWPGDATVYGADSSGEGGFRFCLETTNNRLARIFLYGHIIADGDNEQIALSSIAYSRAD
jgi:prepilin-type N-terminal cleavage/methylation domain-containing protein